MKLLRATTATVLAALGFAACPRLTPAGEPPPPPLPAATRDNADDPLREPPEIHLQHVRQLSFGGRAGAPVFAAAGKTLAFLAWPADGGSARLHLVDVASGRELPPEAAPLGGVPQDVWSSRDGVCLDVTAAACPEAYRCAVSAAVPVTAGADCALPQWPLPRSAGCSETAAGDRACALLSSKGPELWDWPAGAPSPHPVSTLPPEDPVAAFAPDGHSLAWAHPVQTETGGRAPTILSIGSADGPPGDLGPPGQSDLHPAWFPGGKALAFTSNADDAAGRDMDLFRIGGDGQDLERLTFAAGADLWPAVSPDGRRIAWVSERNAAEPGERDVLVAEWLE
ncbi:MAG: TolB family protein [Myxococcales bacterium]